MQHNIALLSLGHCKKGVEEAAHLFILAIDARLLLQHHLHQQLSPGQSRLALSRCFFGEKHVVPLEAAQKNGGQSSRTVFQKFNKDRMPREQKVLEAFFQFFFVQFVTEDLQFYLSIIIV